MSLLHCQFPVVKDVTVGDESSRGINEKPTPGDERNLELIVFIVIPADDRNDRSANGLYCFDGHSFIFSPAVNGKHKQCDENGISHGGTPVISDSVLRK